MKQPPIHVESVIIRFTRQIYYENQAVYQAEVRESPTLLRGGPFQADIEEQLEAFRELFTSRVLAEHRYTDVPDNADPQTTATARNLGAQLYELLPAALREGLPRLLQHVFDKGHHVRLVFEAKAGDQADRLLSMPWEIIAFKELKTYLGLMPRVIIVRRLLETVRQAVPLLTPPFRIAHVIAEPAQYEPIDTRVQEIEQRAIRQAVGQEDLYTLVAHPGSVKHLLAILGTRSYQVVHFLGHGEIEARYPFQSYLLFADENGAPQAVTGELLQRLVSATPGVQLIVLNACHGASVVAAGTVAMQLVYSGIPYVVAMQGEVLQQAAVVFARAFYGAVQRGVSVEQALAQARLAIAAELPSAIDWSLPALYTSLGVLEEAPIARAGSRIERWLGQPEGQRQLGSFSLGFGGVHLLVALLLMLSGASPPLPTLAQVVGVIAVMSLLPPLIAIGARLFGRLPLPTESRWPLSAHAALLLRMLGATALGIGLPAVYAWFFLLLLAALNFWATLAPIAQIVLLVLLFGPCALLSWQEALGHARGFISNARVAAPTLGWAELIVVAAGYIMLCGPLALLWLASQSIAPPLGNLLAGILLMALGYALRKQAADRPAQRQ
jgi:CHAT domain